MTETTGVKITTPGDQEIVIRREFNAPRRLVFEAYTKPELLKRWLLGPPGWEMVVCEVARKAGDRYRYEWRNAEGTQFGLGGVCREFARPERIVCTELMDGYPNESLVTTVLVEQSGRTTLITTCLYESREVRDMVIKSGMESGVEASYKRLDDLFATGQVQEATSAS
ncbi:MAG TPA: SRPBCC family protein [Candidatus Sulfotelmatobacter sp.]|jgi:uncharacterized protein YndB with AHSA1/START domain|nr:SRPBCC family protein [Candidatus Sulfotelmatobacter sp.]